MRKKNLKFVVAIFFCCMANIANATPATYNFSGVLDRITDDYSILNGEFSLGDVFSGTFTFETTTPESNTTLSDPTTAIYSAVTSFRVDINGYIIERDSILDGYLQVWDDRIVGPSIVDAFTVSSGLDFTPPVSGMGPGNVVASANVNLFDFTHNASINGTTIPESISLSDYSGLSFSALQLNTDTNEVFHLNGTISSLSATVPVPLPATIILFGSGALGLISFRTRKKRKLQ